MEKLDVLYTVDNNYAKYMLISLYSLLESNKDIDINIHIIHDGFSFDNFKRIDYIVSQFSNGSVFYYDYGKIASDIEALNIPSWRNSRIPNARAFFSYILPFCDNLLYLDSDTMVIDSLKGLDNYTGTIHMVSDSMPKDHWKNLDSSLEKYCNSGVLWINGKKWIENDCDKKIADILRSDIKLVYPDQDLINVALKDDIEILPPKYDFFPIDDYFSIPFLYMYYKLNNIERCSKEEMKEAKKNPIILHSTPFYGYRTWDKNNIHPFNKYYDEYCHKVFEKIEKDENLDVINALHFMINIHMKLILPDGVKQKIKSILKK